jgi:hypothetical protein
MYKLSPFLFSIIVQGRDRSAFALRARAITKGLFGWPRLRCRIMVAYRCRRSSATEEINGWAASPEVVLVSPLLAVRHQRD